MKMLNWRLLFIVILWMVFEPLFANDVNQDYLNDWARQNKIVGAALVINGQSYFYGYRNKKIPVTDETEFGIGSITKTFISVMILKLEAEGKISIHDSVIKYLPHYSKLKSVTLQSLMQMTAGFNDVLEAGWDATPQQQIEAAYQKYQPKYRGKWQYSNVSYQLLGLLIESVTKQTLAEVLNEMITSPFQLTHIYFPDAVEEKTLIEYQNGIAKTSHFKNMYAAGGLVSNAQDLNQFITHLFVTKDILPIKQYNELITFVATPSNYYAFTKTPAPSFGLGVFKWRIDHIGVLTYPGVVKDGFASTYTVVKNIVIITQSNTYNNNNFTLLWPHQNFTKKLITRFGK